MGGIYNLCIAVLSDTPTLGNYGPPGRPLHVGLTLGHAWAAMMLSLWLPTCVPGSVRHEAVAHHFASSSSDDGSDEEDQDDDAQGTLDRGLATTIKIGINQFIFPILWQNPNAEPKDEFETSELKAVYVKYAQ
ncbi:hypothetical protein Ddc_16299 [Ditylenchus destructor]|nr:hypothetical protein Ddc_16299 [Ditylenchus destructor]